MTENKLPPSDDSIEQFILGAILLEADAINQVIQTINTANIFYNERNKIIWAAMAELYSRNEPIDSVTVFEEIKRKRKSASGEIALYISKLTNGIGSAANIETHAYILKEFYVRRKIIEISTTHEGKAYDSTVDAFEAYDSMLTDLDRLNNEINRASDKSFSELITDKITHLKEAANSHTYVTGIKTFLDDLDRLTLGFQPQDLIIIAARPSMGKTALAIDLARKQATHLNMPVAFFSLEMSAPQLCERILSASTEIPLENIRKGGLKGNEWGKVDSVTTELTNLPIHICDKGGLTLSELYSIAKNWHLKYQIGAIYIDYIGLINNKQRGESREQEISGISRKLKQLAKELNIPVIALSQLSRAVETRGGDKKPILSDLRDSGAIEQDADMVIFPYRASYNDASITDDACELIVAKNRNGKTGVIEVNFNLSTQLFSNRQNIF